MYSRNTLQKPVRAKLLFVDLSALKFRSARKNGGNVSLNPGANCCDTDPVVAEDRSSAQRKIKAIAFRGISPFLLIACCLPVLYARLLISGTQSIAHSLLITLFFLFAEANILFMHFALVNFFQGKRLLRLWVIEVALLGGAVWLLQLFGLLSYFY